LGYFTGGILCQKGTIRNLITDRGFGFIRTAEGTDLFFHRSELQGVDYSSLRTGEQVEFELGKGRDGRPQAVKVRLTETQAQETPPSQLEELESPKVIELASPPPII
jgi:CspA family cold shock protein